MPAEELGAVLTLEILHDQVSRAVGSLPRVEDGDDVRVLQPGRRLGLALEAHDELAVLGEATVKDLQRDPALEVCAARCR